MVAAELGRVVATSLLLILIWVPAHAEQTPQAIELVIAFSLSCTCNDGLYGQLDLKLNLTDWILQYGNCRCVRLVRPWQPIFPTHALL